MARDKRQFAQIDVGWYMNPKWFQVERALRLAMPNAMPDALLHALQDAKQLHLTSILYSAQARWDGMFPVEAVKNFARITHEEAVTALFEVGMWINHPGGMAETRDYLKHQTSSSELEAASEKAKKAAEKRWGNASSNASSNAKRIPESDALSNAEERREEKSREELNTLTQPPVGRTHGNRFDEFWEAYPRKDDKKKAKTIYDRLAKTVPEQTIIDGAHRYAADPNRDPAYTKYPTTWLNAGAWDNEPLPARNDTHESPMARNARSIQQRHHQPNLEPWLQLEGGHQ